MSRRNRPTKTNEQIRNEQVSLVLGELEKDIVNFKLTIEKKDEQVQNFSKILKATKIEFQKIYEENNELKNYILNQQKQKQKNNSNNNNNNKNTTQSCLAIEIKRYLMMKTQ